MLNINPQKTPIPKELIFVQCMNMKTIDIILSVY